MMKEFGSLILMISSSIVLEGNTGEDKAKTLICWFMRKLKRNL